MKALIIVGCSCIISFVNMVASPLLGRFGLLYHVHAL
jgi:hypothetical protein